MIHEIDLHTLVFFLTLYLDILFDLLSKLPPELVLSSKV